MATATKVRFRFRVGGTKVLRPGLWYGNPTTDTAVLVANHAALVAAARGAVSSSGLMDGFDDSVVFEEAEAQNFTRVAGVPSDPKPSLQVDHWEALSTTTESSGADVPGTQTGDSLPVNCSVVYSVYSAVPGPRGRNRLFGPPPEEEEVNTFGIIDSARVTQLQADFDTVVSAITTALPAGEGLVVASAVTNSLVPPTGGVLQSKIRSQRVRLR